jgi:Ca-activated chloride channel family protein
MTALCWSALLLSSAAHAFATPPDEEEPEAEMSAAPMPAAKMRMSYDFADVDAMGVTPGGAQDIGHARDRILDGEVPHPQVFTPEGLFSEHDLPLRPGGECKQTICVDGEAVRATLLAQDDVRYLAQIGFRSGIDASTWQREPLNLVAVVDTSGSMSGEPLALVRESLLEVVSQLGPRDQLSVVLYDSHAHLVLAPTKIKSKKRVQAGIASIQSGGSTSMEEGLKLGFSTAHSSARSFVGTTRVMLFTDERPNTGRTDAGSFMGMARAASRRGVGLTTVGVSTHFGAELATEISSVRGGNLFFFPNVSDMKRVFEDEFDTMVTELGYDMKLTVRPAKGTKITGVYGIPGEMLEWKKGGAIELGIETLFASKKKGAVYVGFAPNSSSALPKPLAPDGSSVGSVSVSYESVRGRREADGASFTLSARDRASAGLRHGVLLVDQATAMKRAASLHHEHNDQEGAFQLIRRLATRFRHRPDPELANERETIFALETTLARLSGHLGEGEGMSSSVASRLRPKRDMVSGLPPRPVISD